MPEKDHIKKATLGIETGYVCCEFYFIDIFYPNTFNVFRKESECELALHVTFFFFLT